MVIGLEDPVQVVYAQVLPAWVVPVGRDIVLVVPDLLFAFLLE